MPGSDFSTQLNNFASAIRRRESEGTGGYQAVGVATKHGRALGGYGIMSDFWSEWAEEAGIPGADWRDPAAQDHVAKYKMAEYYKRYGDWASVAAAWIGGPGGAAEFRKGREGASDALGTSVKEYVTDVVGYYQESGGQAGQNPEVGGIPQGGGTYNPNNPPVTDLGVDQQPLGDPFGNQGNERVRHENAVESVLGAVSSVIAGGNRQPVEQVASNLTLPGGNKEQNTGQTVTAAGDEEIEEAPSTPNPDMAENHFDGLNPTFEAAVNQMIADAPGSISISSGFRSVQRQKELWNQALKKYGSPAVARKWVAPPGNSKHNHGLAADLKYASDEVKRWAHENAAKYGLTFPLSNEDWHIEPIGAR